MTIIGPDRKLRVGIVGCGAIGGWLGASLAKAGCEVSVLARQNTLTALRNGGLSLVNGDATNTYAVVASDDATFLGPQDYVVIALKAQVLTDVFPSLLPLFANETKIITAMNGVPWWFFQKDSSELVNFVPDAVDPAGRISQIAGTIQIIGAVVHATARVVAPGRSELIRQDRVMLGLPSGGVDRSCAMLIEAFRQGGVNAQAADNIRAEIWSKLWGNATMNPLSVLTGATTGRMLDEPDVRSLCLAMMHEINDIGRRVSLALPSSPEDRIEVTRRLGDFKTSMLQDAEAGRPLEIEPILGVLAEVAAKLDLPVPHIRMVLGMVRLKGEAVAAAPVPKCGGYGGGAITLQ